jgi:hypothetical protein
MRMSLFPLRRWGSTARAELVRELAHNACDIAAPAASPPNRHRVLLSSPPTPQRRWKPGMVRDSRMQSNRGLRPGEARRCGAGCSFLRCGAPAGGRAGGTLCPVPSSAPCRCLRWCPTQACRRPRGQGQPRRPLVCPQRPLKDGRGEPPAPR